MDPLIDLGNTLLQAAKDARADSQQQKLENLALQAEVAALKTKCAELERELRFERIRADRTHGTEKMKSAGRTVALHVAEEQLRQARAAAADSDGLADAAKTNHLCTFLPFHKAMSSERNPTLITPPRVTKVRPRSDSRSPSPCSKRPPTRQRLDDAAVALDEAPEAPSGTTELSTALINSNQSFTSPNPRISLDTPVEGIPDLSACRLELLSTTPLSATHRDALIAVLDAHVVPAPLSLSIPASPSEFLRPLMVAFAPHLRYLTMELCADSLYRDHTTALPQLTSYAICLKPGSDGHFGRVEGSFNLIDVQKAPALRRLVVGTVNQRKKGWERDGASPPRLSLVDLPPCLRQLTFFRATRVEITPNELLRILADCPRLKECLVSSVLMHQRDPWVRLSKPVSVLHLRDLALLVGRGFKKFEKEFLGSLYTPGLLKSNTHIIHAPTFWKHDLEAFPGWLYDRFRPGSVEMWELT
ncbi:hypothetical protein C8R46DRAFT_1227195 [Mycena filopes]|nr:hypothetical protein C8R46DRAFT_1227195 [Mycena filopes]